MINVAFFAMAPFISGSERCLQLILTNCREQDINPILIAPPESPLLEWANNNNIKSYPCSLKVLDSSKPWLWLMAQIKLFLILYTNKIQVIHSNQIWSYPASVLPSKLLNIKRVCHFRDPINNGSRWWLREKLNASICISKHILKEYSDIFPETHSNKTYQIIDPVAFQKKMSIAERKEKRILAKKTLALTSSFTFGFIGQIAPIKGLLELIKVLNQLNNRHWTLIIAGVDPSADQAYITQCKELIEQYNLENNIKFIGFIDDISLFYAAVDLVCMFSLEEPLGLIPLEAAVCYTPTIANSVGGLPETIEHNKTGWLIDINNQADTINTINEAMNSDLFLFGAQARTRVEQLSHPSVHCETLKKIFMETLHDA